MEAKVKGEYKAARQKKKSLHDENGATESRRINMNG